MCPPVPVPFPPPLPPPPPRGLVTLPSLLASFIFSCGSSLSSTFNFQYPKSCFRCGRAGSAARTVGPDAGCVVSGDESGGRIGPGEACACSTAGNAAHPVPTSANAASILTLRNFLMFLPCIVPLARHNVDVNAPALHQRANN